MAKSELAIRDGWFPRILRALRLVEVRPDGSTTHNAGSDFIGDDPGSRTYSAINSMAAMARFPWVRACVEAVSSDLTKVPHRIIKGRGKDAETIEDHPFFDLMERPNSRTPGILFARQLVVDMLLTGDAFALVAGQGEPRALLRLHPERVKIVPNDDGQVKEYEYNGAGSVVRYGYEQVLHFRSPSWQSNPSMLYGSGAIESLHNDLTTDLAASELAAKSAQTGLPTGIISPAESSDIWTKPQITQLREGFEKQLRQKSGTVILGAGVEYKQLSHSLRDLEYQETRNMAKEAVMAALGVVPVRVGVESANYASSRQQMRLYWEQLQSRSMLMDSEWTRLLRMFPDSDGLRVVSDFSEVDALQESRTERVNRVNTWWMMGVSLQEAAALEGFENLNAEETTEAEPEPQEETDAEQVARWLVYDNQQNEQADTEKAAKWISGSAHTVDLDTDEGRAIAWRSFIDRVHTPHERRIASAMRRYLRQQAARIAKNLKEELGNRSVTKSIDPVVLDRVLDEAFERQELLTLFRPLYRRAMQQAFDEAAKNINADLLFGRRELELEATAAVRQMATSILSTTGDKVGKLVNDLIAEGATLPDMQAAIVQGAGFTPARAMTIARTETTRIANGAANRAYHRAEESGIQIEKMWLSARDSDVRDAHMDLDGTTVPAKGVFTYEGATAANPGEFGTGELDINCRCSTIARVVK